MNEIINKFLLAVRKFMPEMHLIQAGFTNSASGSSATTRNKYKNLQKQEIQDIFIKTS